MSDAWLTVCGLMVTTVAIKASGPVLLGGRELPAWSRRVIALLAPAVLSALVVTETFSDGRSLVVDERAAGLLGAVVVLLLRGPVLLAIVTAAVVAATVNAIAG
jgi:branched-subunit amino acid transport protein